MKKILKKFVAVFSVASMLIPSAALAADDAHIVYTREGNDVIATATVTADGEEKILVVSSYKDGFLKEIKTDRMYVNGTETLTATVKAGVDEVIANIIDGFGKDTASSKAEYAADTLDVRAIMINGKKLAGFSEEVNEYMLQADAGEVDIDVITADSTTKVEITGNTSPGKAEISLTSSRGQKKKIYINLYDTEEKTYTLSSLKYLIGDEEYEIENFKPDAYSYRVELPDNTMNVRLAYETAGQAKVYVTDTWVSSIDGVELGKIVDTCSEAFAYKRNSLNNLIPIKNEVATAEITVSNGKAGKNNKESNYKIEFTARQPRLTEFNMTGCENDTTKPAFVGGSAVNNDNGTIITTQNGWAVGNITESLLGGSMFMFADIRKSEWWLTNSPGDYFNFTADTPGTIYVISGETFKNTSEYTENGWSKLPGNEPTNFPSEWAVNYRQIRKDYNDWNVDYLMSCLYYNSANAKEKRAIDPGIAQTTVFDDAGVTSRVMVNGYSKKFEAGENVKVFNSGRSDWNAASICAVIKWDEEYVKYAPKSETEAIEDEEIELLPELLPLKVTDPSVIIDVEFNEKTDTESEVWKDESGKGNDIVLDSEIGEWTENGYKVQSGKGEIGISSAVAEALSSRNCTLEFEISDVVFEGSSNVAIFSQTDDVFLYSTNSQVVLKNWNSGTVQNRPKINFEQLIGKKQTIVFDNTSGKIYWYTEGVDSPVSKNMKSTASTEKFALGSASADYAGSVTFKSFKVYDRVLTAEEINGGEAE